MLWRKHGVMNNTMTLSDTRPLLAEATALVTPLVGSLTASDLDRPTPCSEWTVRDLLSHLVAVEDRVVHIAGGGHPFETPSMIEGIADDAWAHAWNSRLAPLSEALADDAVLGRIFQHPAGPMPGAAAIGIYASEFAVHAWDLARALGRDAELDPTVAEAVVGPITAALPAEPRGAEIGIPFGPVVDVPADAPAFARLVAWVGRNPEWTPNAS